VSQFRLFAPMDFQLFKLRFWGFGIVPTEQIFTYNHIICDIRVRELGILYKMCMCVPIIIYYEY